MPHRHVTHPRNTEFTAELPPWQSPTEYSLGVALFANLGFLATQRAEVVELCPAHVTARNNLDVVDDRGVQRERTLHAHLEADFAHNEGFGDAVTRAGNHNTLEDLDTRTGTFDNVHVNFDGISGAEVGNIATQAGCVNKIERLHYKHHLLRRHRSHANNKLKMLQVPPPDGGALLPCGRGAVAQSLSLPQKPTASHSRHNIETIGFLMKTKATPTMSSLNELRNVRTQPIQQRSSDRMKSLLDAAAILIDEEGIDGVTTTAVAYRSRSSVGVLYRYFPNVDSLLKALAQRNMSRYLDRVHEGAQKTSDEPWSAWDNTLDSYVDMCRHEPGFRSLGFGDIINERFLDEELSNNSVIARAFAEQLAETHNVPVTDTMMFHLDAGIAMGAALIHRAFLYEPRGDKKFIEECRTVIGTYLRSQLPLTS